MWPKVRAEVHGGGWGVGGGARQVVGVGFGACQREGEREGGDQQVRAPSVPLSVSPKVQQALGWVLCSEISPGPGRILPSEARGPPTRWVPRAEASSIARGSGTAGCSWRQCPGPFRQAVMRPALVTPRATSSGPVALIPNLRPPSSPDRPPITV